MDVITHTSLHRKDGYKCYYSIDLFKFIFAFFIIAIHTAPFSDVNSGVEMFTSVIWKLAVPFYFASSGFLFFNRLIIDNGKIKRCKENYHYFKKYIFRIIILYTVWSAIYFLHKTVYMYHFKLNIHIIKDFVFSYFITASYYHMWYILCLIYAVTFIFFSLQFLNYKLFLGFSVIMYLIGLLSYGYAWLANLELLNAVADRLDCVYYAIFRAVPLIFAGCYYSIKGDKKVNKFNYVITTFLLIALFFESYFINGKECPYSYIVFTLPLCYSLFFVLVNLGVNPKASNKYKIIRNMSTIIYCVHPLFYDVLSAQEMFSLFRFILVSICSSLFAMLVYKLSCIKKLNIFRYLY